MEMYDIMLDPDLDIEIEGGDFAVGESTGQHQTLLLLSAKGEWKQTPARGVGVAVHIEAGDHAALARDIRSDFTADGMVVDSVELDGTNLNVEACYEEI